MTLCASEYAREEGKLVGRLARAFTSLPMTFFDSGQEREGGEGERWRRGERLARYNASKWIPDLHRLVYDRRAASCVTLSLSDTLAQTSRTALGGFPSNAPISCASPHAASQGSDTM